MRSVVLDRSLCQVGSIKPVFARESEKLAGFFVLGYLKRRGNVMEGATEELAPWEVPPDEAYWQDLLNEGECSKAPVVFAKERGSNSDVEQNTAEQVTVFSPEETYPHVIDGEPVSWDTFLKYQAEDEPIDLPVVGFNRGGLLIKWNGIVGFVPASQLCEGIPPGNEQMRRKLLAERVGNTLTLKVIEADPDQNRLILSERAARRVQEPDLTLLTTLRSGDICQGKVTNLCSFGAFVDLGGVEGLIHISELSWGRISHPADVLQSGQEIEVYVLNVDQDRGRVGLSLKRLYADPWDTVDSRYETGQVVEGSITNIVNFGVFVRIEDGLEGLIHTSELSDHISASQHAIHEGQVVRVRIVRIDRSRHRMSLSMDPVSDDSFL
jgi:small subunit ribosomal protein S1